MIRNHDNILLLVLFIQCAKFHGDRLRGFGVYRRHTHFNFHFYIYRYRFNIKAQSITRRENTLFEIIRYLNQFLFWRVKRMILRKESQRIALLRRGF